MRVIHERHPVKVKVVYYNLNQHACYQLQHLCATANTSWTEHTALSVTQQKVKACFVRLGPCLQFVLIFHHWPWETGRWSEVHSCHPWSSLDWPPPDTQRSTDRWRSGAAWMCCQPLMWTAALEAQLLWLLHRNTLCVSMWSRWKGLQASLVQHLVPDLHCFISQYASLQICSSLLWRTENLNFSKRKCDKMLDQVWQFQMSSGFFCAIGKFFFSL